LLKELLHNTSSVEIGGKKYRLKKWKLRKSLIYSATVADVMKQAIGGFADNPFPEGKQFTGDDGKVYVADVPIPELIQYFIIGLKDVNFTQMVIENIDAILDIISGTLEDCDEIENSEIQEIVDNMEIVDVLAMGKEIIALNFLSVKDSIVKMFPGQTKK